MENVVKLEVPSRPNSKAACQARLLSCFSENRRFGDDVYWLKENAELLNILESTGAAPAAEALAVYGHFYDTIEKQLEFFPQYYRFLLSICLDLEDLGIGGNKGAALAQWVADRRLVGAELSDLQRAEARRLCLRRGVNPLRRDPWLDDRLRAFARRNETFAIPNKKAAYELTHIVFYLSEYGRVDPRLDAAFIRSLKSAATLAFLELNVDLLSEICLALRFAGQKPADAWSNWLRRQGRAFFIRPDVTGPIEDEYHPFLMVNWFLQTAGFGGFCDPVPPGRVTFHCPQISTLPLQELSECVYEMGEARRDDWHAIRGAVTERLSEEAVSVVIAAEAASDSFDRFFADFARTGMSQVNR